MVLHVALGELLDLVLPGECAVCGSPARPLCPRCRRLVRAVALGGLDGAHAVVVPTASAPPVHAWGAYAGPLAPLVTAWKDHGRRDLTGELGRLLARSVAAATGAAGWGSGPVLVVPVPSSRAARRRRGDAPVELLARAALHAVRSPSPAAAGAPLRLAPALALRRAVADQARLGATGRRANLAGAMAVHPLWHDVVHGRRCLVVDDVVTTGSTLAEAARALGGAGAAGVVAAVVAATPGPAGAVPRGAGARGV